MATRRKSTMGLTTFETAASSLPIRRAGRLSTIPKSRVQPKKTNNATDDFVSGEVFAFEPILTPRGPLTRARRSSVFLGGASATAPAVGKSVPTKLVVLSEADEAPVKPVKAVKPAKPAKAAKPTKPIRAVKIVPVKVVLSPVVTPVAVSPKGKKTPGRRARIVTPVSDKHGEASNKKSAKKYAKTPAANKSGKKAEAEPTSTRKSTRKFKVEDLSNDANVVKSVRKSARKIAQDAAVAKVKLMAEDPASSTPMPSQQADTEKAESKLMKLLVTLTPTTPKIFNALSKRVFFTDFARANLPRSPYVLMKGWTETGTPVEHMEKLDVNLGKQKTAFSPIEPEHDTPDSPMPRNPKRKLNISDLVDEDDCRVSPKKACFNNTSVCEDPQLVTGYLGKMCTIM